MNSSAEYTIQESGKTFNTWLGPDLNNVETRVICSVYSKELLHIVNIINEKPDCYASIVALRLLQDKGLEASIAAHLEAYVAYQRGVYIARRKGLDTLLYLTCSRNIGKVLEEAAPRYGEKVLVLITPSSCTERAIIPNRSKCSIPASTRRSLTTVATYILEARVYRPTYET